MEVLDLFLASSQCLRHRRSCLCIKDTVPSPQHLHHKAHFPALLVMHLLCRLHGVVVLFERRDVREKLEGESGSRRSTFMVRQFVVAIFWIG